MHIILYQVHTGDIQLYTFIRLAKVDVNVQLHSPTALVSMRCFPLPI
jgi:hypothetical protein